MSEARWDRVQKELNEFQGYLAPHVPKLRIESVNDRNADIGVYQERRKSGIFNRGGVYLIFAPDESLQYVGLAMVFDKRVWTHDDHVQRRWTDVICLSGQLIFLAPSLEFFLISRLDPLSNRNYRGYSAAVPSPIISSTDADPSILEGLRGWQQ